jgi:hypothetical protein
MLAQPNNRILWNIPSYTTKINKPDYKVQTTYWNVENMDWKTDDTNDMFYDIQEKDKKNLSSCTVNDIIITIGEDNETFSKLSIK